MNELMHILAAIVESYVETGSPVSSRFVRDAGGFHESTATIRNRMAALEERGFIAKPHTSSGRVPTDDGYRAYVDEVVAERGAGPAEAMVTRCRMELRAHGGDVSGIMMCASQLLAALSRHVAVIYGEVEQDSRVRNLRLVRLDAARLLVLVTFEPTHERTTILRFDREFDPLVVIAAESTLNALVAGLSLALAHEALAGVVRDNVTDEGIIIREVAGSRDAIFFEAPAVEYVFEERHHLFDQQELADPKNLQRILRILHNRHYLTSMLAARSHDGTEVTIGSEHVDDLLRPFSVVTSGYRMGAARGVLGIIGPTRMRYDVALGVVSSVSRELRAIGEEFF